MAPLPIVFGVMRDKEAVPMLRALAPVATRFVFTEAATTRARPAVDLPALAGEAGIGRALCVVPHPAGAVRAALADADRVCVTGSIFLIGDIIRDLDAGHALD